jgi:mannose-6-phosphate isomerase-like protein (cupin superfamily)
LVGAVSTLAPDGSWIGLDVVNTDMLESPFTAAYMKKLTELGCGWRFATSEPERFFARFGWTGKLIAPGDPEAHYDRWPFPPLPRALPGIPRSFLLSASKGAPLVEQHPAPVSAQSAEHYRWGQQCDGWHLVKHERLSVIQERMPPGATEVRHRHARAMQFFYVLSGALKIEVEGVTYVLDATHGLEVTAGAAHQVMTPGPAAADFLVVSQPRTAGDREPAPAR